MRKLTNRDINNLLKEFAKPYIGYDEKCGIALGLEILGFITENTYQLLADNFEQQAFNNIPISEFVFKHILMRSMYNGKEN